MLLGLLRGLQRHVRVGEIGAGILPVGIEEEIVERAGQVVVVRDVGPGARGGVVLVDGAARAPDRPRQPPPPQPVRQRGVPRGERQQPLQVIAVERERAVHVGLAQCQFGPED
jgi:hypothetical protein